MPAVSVRSLPRRTETGVRGAGSGDRTRLPGFEGPSGGLLAQPISSSALPFVSFTNFQTNGIESAAKTV